VEFSSLPNCGENLSHFVPVFQNLIGNSLKYRNPQSEPVIAISSERVGKEWVIHVRDNGIGFKPEQASELFGVFKRLHGSQYPGTGVGLAICKRIVERHGGKIWATASPESGAIFSFSIPAEPVELALQAKDGTRTPQSTTQTLANTAAPDIIPAVAAPFDEFFQTLDLAQAMVRDLHGTILVWTKGAERLFGWSKNEAMGKRAHDLLKTKFPQPLEQIETNLLNTGEWKGQLQKFKKDGSRLWLASHWALYRDGSGRPQSVIEVNNDITALKEAEEALEQSSWQRDLALSAGEMGIWRWDITAGVVEWDQTVERLHGMTPGSFNGTFEAFEDRVHPSERDSVKQRIEEALRQGPGYKVEYRALHADGDYRWLRGRGHVIRENGVAKSLIGVVWKITSGKPADPG
jgi:PAS domain S-box-containing protein